MDVGDLVTRKSHGHDIIFRIEKILDDAAGHKTALLRGVFWRLLADAPMKDLHPARNTSITYTDHLQALAMEQQRQR
jgi:spore coat assembly protein